MNHQSKYLKFVLNQPKMRSKEDLSDIEEKEQISGFVLLPELNNCSDYSKFSIILLASLTL